VDRACSTYVSKKEYVQNSRRKETSKEAYSYREDNIKLNLREIGWGAIDWIHLSHKMDQWRVLVTLL
jgi:hypothetical protein